MGTQPGHAGCPNNSTCFMAMIASGEREKLFLLPGSISQIPLQQDVPRPVTSLATRVWVPTEVKDTGRGRSGFAPHPSLSLCPEPATVWQHALVSLKAPTPEQKVMGRNPKLKNC